MTSAPPTKPSTTPAMAAAAAPPPPSSSHATITTTITAPPLAAGMPSPAESAILAATASCYSKHHPTSARPSSLRTPLSATFPSSLHSPMTAGMRTPASASFLRATNDSIKTPLTPPSAYLEFLNKVSPSVGSPLNSATSTHFSWSARSPTVAFSSFHHPSAARPMPPPTSAPSGPVADRATCPPPLRSVVRTTSPPTDAATNTTAATTTSAPAAPVSRETANTGRPLSRSTSFSSEPPRRPSLIIPPSPTTRSPSLMSPASAMRSPGSITPLTAGGSQKVTVRYSVTKTITRTYTQLSRLREREDSGSDLSDDVETVVSDETDKEETDQKVKEESKDRRPLVGEAPRGKRRKTSSPGLEARKAVKFEDEA